MSTQAEETIGELAIEAEEIEAEVETTDEAEEVSEEAETPAETEEDEVELVINGEDEPTSKQDVPKGFLKRINKLNSKVEEAQAGKTQAELKAEALAEQNKLLVQQLQARSQPQSGPPLPENYETDEQYTEAARQYQARQLQQMIDQKVTEREQLNAKTAAQSMEDQKLNDALKQHYERAEKLKVKDYEVVEDVAIEAMGKDIAKYVMANIESSQNLMYVLGKRPDKAAYFGRLIHENPIKGMLELGAFSKEIIVKSKTSNAPSPETEISGGKVGGYNYAGPSGATFS